MSARRFRAAPTASRGGMRIGVTLTPTGTSSQTQAQIAAERARLAAEDAVACKSPVTMRWRFFPEYVDSYTADQTPDSDPPAFPYVFTPFNAAEITAGSEDYPDFGESAITIPLDEAGAPTITGLFFIDFLDADGRVILCRTNIANGCSPSAAVPAAVTWAVDYLQDDAGEPGRYTPNVYPDADNRMSVWLSPFDALNPGVLTIAATDAWSSGGPFEFGPLTITFTAPPA